MYSQNMLIYCTINSVAFYMFRPADTATPPPLGWCQHTHTACQHTIQHKWFYQYFIFQHIF